MAHGDEMIHSAKPTDVTKSLPRVAVLLPCLNEEAAIAAVVEEVRATLPQATIYVYDNNSTDRTAEIARSVGAIVRREAQPGKGHVLRRMFAEIEADIYVLLDGDGTYAIECAPALINMLVGEGLDMVSGARRPVANDAFRRGHKFGNRFLSWIVGLIFGQPICDMLTGYRVLSRRFVKSFPSLSEGFEIETEMTVHALELRMPVAEVWTPYRERAGGTASKLHTVRDGFKILLTLLRLVKHERPLSFFAIIGAALALLSIGLAVPLFETYIETGLVPRFPTAILSAAIMILAFLSIAAGLILDSVTYGRREMKRLHYLSYPSPMIVPRSPD